MGETAKAEQDTPSAGAGQSSGGKGGTTSKDKGKLYTVAEIDKIKSDSAAEAGRKRVAAEGERDSLTQDLESTRSRLDSLEKEVNESRLAEARNDPEALRIYQREQAIVKRERAVGDKERDVTSRESALKDERVAIDKDKSVVSIAYIAAKHGLDAEKLESFGISDPEALKKVAEELAAAKPPEPGKGEGEGEGEGEEEFTPDSGEGTGGGAEALTAEAIEKMPIASVEKAIEKAEPKSK